MRIGLATKTEREAIKRLAEVRGITSKPKQEIKTEKLEKLKTLSEAYLKELSSSESSSLASAQEILEENVNNHKALKILKKENLLDLVINKVNEKSTDNKYSLNTIDSLSSSEKKTFIDIALSLSRDEGSIYRNAASQYDTKNQGDNFLQKAVMLDAALSKATANLLAELKSDPESLKLFLSDRSLMNSSFVILTNLQELDQAIPMDTETKDIQVKVHDFLEQLKFKAKNDEISYSYRGADRVNSIRTDEPLIDTIISTKSDKELLKAVQQLAENHSNETDFQTGFHYIQSNKFRDKVKAAYGNGVFAELRAYTLQSRIKHLISGTGSTDSGFRTDTDKFNDNLLNTETKVAYSGFIAAQKNALAPELVNKVNKAQNQLNALDGTNPEQIQIKNEFRRDLNDAAANLRNLIGITADDIGKNALSSLMNMLIDQSIKKAELEAQKDTSTDPSHHKLYELMEKAQDLFLNSLRQSFKELNNLDANGPANRNLMNLMHERILDYLVPSSEKDPTQQHSALDDLRTKLIHSVIDKALRSGNYDDQRDELEKIKNETDLSALKHGFTENLFKEFTKLFSDTLSDLYGVAGLTYNTLQSDAVEERLKNPAIHHDDVFYDVIKSGFERKSFTG